MGSKKKHQKHKKHSKKPGKNKTGHGGGKKPIRTTFMTAFIDRFIRDPGTGKQSFMSDLGASPGPAIGPPLQDFTTVVEILTKKEGLLTLPPVGPGSLGEQVIAFLNAQNWPSGTAVPEKFEEHRLTVHLYEISVIADQILRAINEGTGGGGTPTAWPPH